MINSIKNLIEKAIKIYIENESLTKNKEKLAESIVKKIIDKVKDAYFWYLNSSENVCTHIFKKGKKEGYMCQKKIKTNLLDDKEDYLCCKHSKKHIPRKRVKKEKKKDEPIKKIKVVTKTVAINRDIKKVYKNREKKCIKKVFICNSGNINIGKILSSLIN